VPYHCTTLQPHFLLFYGDAPFHCSSGHHFWQGGGGEGQGEVQGMEPSALQPLPVHPLKSIGAVASFDFSKHLSKLSASGSHL
jgi:hypothetical protein